MLTEVQKARNVITLDRHRLGKNQRQGSCADPIKYFNKYFFKIINYKKIIIKKILLSLNKALLNNYLT